MTASQFVIVPTTREEVIQQWAASTVGMIEQDLVDGALTDAFPHLEVDDDGIDETRRMIHDLVITLIKNYNLRHIDSRLVLD